MSVENVAMTTIRDMLAEVLRHEKGWMAPPYLNVEQQQEADAMAFDSLCEADALLASPQLAAIVDLAASVAEQTDLQLRFVMSPAVRALLESWRGSRAERPTP